MKKLSSMLVVLAVATSAFIMGCDVSDSQQKMIARTAGMVAAATWRGIDNPSSDEIASMKIIVAKIQEACCTNCTDDASYYARVYPLVDEYITAKVKPADQAMCRLGAAFILTSMDTAFAVNPTWKKDADKTVAIIEAFCEGAQVSLSLPATDPIVRAAMRQTAVRVKIKTVK
jgi:hypothetical protein